MEPGGGEVGESRGQKGWIISKRDGGRPAAESVGLILAFLLEAPVLVAATSPMKHVVIVEVWMAFGSKPFADVFRRSAFFKHEVEFVADGFWEPCDFGATFWTHRFYFLLPV